LPSTDCASSAAPVYAEDPELRADPGQRGVKRLGWTHSDCRNLGGTCAVTPAWSVSAGLSPLRWTFWAARFRPRPPFGAAGFSSRAAQTARQPSVA
jgi:hypothetical protein